MNLRAKMDEWQSAGLLSADAAANILRYEEQRRRRPYLLYALGALGALSVATGVVALISSNWDAIPAGVKLALDVAMVAGLSAGIVRADARGAAWARDTLLVLQYGVVLASIGLVAQVYHLGGATYQALLVWSALTAFLMSRGESAAVNAIWVLGLEVTCGAGLVELADLHDKEDVAASLAYVVPLVCLGVAGARPVAHARPKLARVLRDFGWAEIAFAGSIGPLGFYDDKAAEHRSGLFYLGVGVAAAATAAVAARAAPREPEAARRAAQAVLVVAFIATFLPFVVPWGAVPVAAALAFIAFWAVVGWAGYASRRLHILNLATAMIGLRILIAYFEVFGSLLDTGVGLITGGLLTLGMAWLWVRKSKDLKQKLAPDDAGREDGSDA